MLIGLLAVFGGWPVAAAAAVSNSPAPVHMPAPVDTTVTESSPGLTVPGPDWIALEQWGRETVSVEPRRISASLEPSYEIQTEHHRLVIQTEKQEAFYDGLQLRLGFAPILVGDRPFVHSLDLQKNIAPLLLTPEIRPPSGRTIVIDPGHGGGNAGAKSVLDGSQEKEFTLDWAHRLASLLADNGWTVHLTRTNDVPMLLSERVAFAEACEADLFISLHFNASGDGNHQAGVETFCLTPTGMVSHVTRGFPDDPSVSFTNNAFDLENLMLATSLHRALVEANGRVDRGIRRARFMTVLRDQNRPAVLVEGGFLSNPDEARRVADPEHRQKLAEALAAALGPPAEAERPASASPFRISELPPEAFLP